MKKTLTLPMRIISKKNSKRWIYRGGRKFLVPSEAYERFKLVARTEIYQHFNGKMPNISQSVRVSCIFHVKGAYRVDGDNLFTSILDILEDCRVISNDNLVLEGSFKKIGGAADWYTEINIELLNY